NAPAAAPRAAEGDGMAAAGPSDADLPGASEAGPPAWLSAARGPAVVAGGAPAIHAPPPPPVVTPTPACDTTKGPPAPSANVLYLDARDGNITENNVRVTGRRRFKTGTHVTIVVDNKHPYLYPYKFSSTATPTAQSALH